MVNGAIVLADGFEGVPVGSMPVAEFGTWEISGNQITVLDAGFPGPTQGRQYLQIQSSDEENEALRAVLTLPATNSGDIFQFDAMAYVSPLAYGYYGSFQFFALNTNSPYGDYSQVPINGWIVQDGTIYNSTSAGAIPTLTHIAFGKWQHWQIQYVVGSGKWSWLVDGDGDNNLAVNSNVTNATLRSFVIEAFSNVPGISLYLDGMPEPVLLNPRVSQGMFAFDIQTVAGVSYLLQYKNNLTDVNWQSDSSIIVGDGSMETFNEQVASAGRYYRLCVK
jgi:hypothetical protein